MDALAFAAVAAVVIATPGPDTALTVRNTLFGGRAAGLRTAAGVAAGQATWTVAASAGLAALIVASEPAFAALRALGAAYLVYLGARSLAAALRGGHAAEAPRRGGSAFRQGLLSNLANPKMAVFFTSLLPQFVPAGAPAFAALLGLGLAFAGLTLAWLSLYAVLVARAGDVLRRSRLRRALDAAFGAALVLLGLRVAAAPR